MLLPEPGVEQCPACGATLTAVPNSPAEIKGVTTLDTEAILRARSEISRPRGNRLLSFITGEIPVDTSTPAAAEVFAPPPEDVRREMMRLQAEAHRADLVAETVAIKSDELARLGIHVSELGADEPGAADGAVSGAPEGVAQDAADTAEAAAPEAGPSATEPDAGPSAAAPGRPRRPAAGWPVELTPEEPQPVEPQPVEPEAESRG